MSKFVCGVVLLLVVSSAALAESKDGYAFFAPGQWRGGGYSDFAVFFGGGIRCLAENGAGIGGELAIAGPKEGFGSYYFGMLSPNAYYVFKTSNDKTKPFVTGGYTRSFGHGSGANMINFGAGFTHWAAEKTGILVEFRNHIRRDHGVTQNLWALRLGATFR